MKINNQDIISVGTLKSSSRLTFGSIVVISAILWRSDFKDIRIAEINVLEQEAFFWIALVILSLQLATHVVSWLDDYFSYRIFDNIVEDLNAQLADLLKDKEREEPRSRLGKQLHLLLGELGVANSELPLASELAKRMIRTEHGSENKDLPRLLDQLHGQLNATLAANQSVATQLKALQDEIADALPRVKRAWRALFFNFFLLRGAIPTLLGAIAIFMLLKCY